MLRWIRRILLITLLMIHVAIVALWWDSWHTIRVPIFPESTQRFGIWSGDGMVILNARDPAIKAQRLWADFWPSLIKELKVQDTRAVYFDPLRLSIPSKQFAFEKVDIPASPQMSIPAGSLRAIRRPGMNPPDRFLRICFPYWFAAAVSGAAVWPWIGWIVFRRRRARRRDRAGLCPKCGYDMRANPARCSECGYAPSTEPMRLSANRNAKSAISGHTCWRRGGRTC